MKKPSMKKLPLLALVVLVAGCLGEERTLAQRFGVPAAPTPTPPEVVVEPQPDAPVRISSIKTQWVMPERNGVELYVVVENTDARAVRAYSTRDTSGDMGNESCMVFVAVSQGKMLKAGATSGMSTWRGFGPQFAHPMRRSVDYVEFADGSTWGQDVCGTAELLAAGREGARAARALLRQRLSEGGAEAVMEALRTRLEGMQPPEGRTPRWQRAFLGGVRAYAERILRAAQEWGETEIEAALARPIDASEASQQ